MLQDGSYRFNVSVTQLNPDTDELWNWSLNLKLFGNRDSFGFNQNNWMLEQQKALLCRTKLVRESEFMQEGGSDWTKLCSDSGTSHMLCLDWNFGDASRFGETGLDNLLTIFPQQSQFTVRAHNLHFGHYFTYTPLYISQLPPLPQQHYSLTVT